MEEKTHIFAPDLGMALLGVAGCATLPEDNPAGLANPARGSSVDTFGGLYRLQDCLKLSADGPGFVDGDEARVRGYDPVTEAELGDFSHGRGRTTAPQVAFDLVDLGPGPQRGQNRIGFFFTTLALRVVGKAGSRRNQTSNHHVFFQSAQIIALTGRSRQCLGDS